MEGTVFVFTAEDAVAALEKSPNLNSSLKNFLKREVRRGEPGERFVKDLRAAFEGGEARALAFVRGAIDKFERHLVALGSYAHADLVAPLAQQILDQHADTFNDTYRMGTEEIEVTNRSAFDEIVAKVMATIDETLAEHGFAESFYMKNVVLVTIFEPAVLRHIISQHRQAA